MRGRVLLVFVLAVGCGRTPLARFGQASASDSDGRGTGDDGDTRDGTDDSHGPGQTATSVGDGTSGSDSGSTGSTGMISCVDSPELCTVQLSLRRAVDILFVV